MFVHRLAASARKILPELVVAPIRRIATAMLTPVAWSYHTGHFRSALKGVAVDRDGQPLIWYTYAAIEFLRYKDFTGKRVLEFGAGQSTLWWAARASEVISFEDNAAWYERLLSQMPQNVSLRLISSPAPTKEICFASGPFDIIVIDGLGRLECAQVSADLLTDDGAILFDNSEGTWGGDHDGSYPIIDLLHAAGFSRIDFYGWCPGGIAPSCTSLFFKNRCFLLSGSDHPVRRIT
jgi:predicted O-methyltransferase YrrM